MKKVNITLITCFMLLIPGWLNAQDNNFVLSKYYYVELITNPDRADLPQEAIDSIQTAHLARLGALFEMGKLMLAGPFEKGGGILILKTETEQEAVELIKKDPAIAANRLLYEVRAWYTVKEALAYESEQHELK